MMYQKNIKPNNKNINSCSIFFPIKQMSITKYKQELTTITELYGLIESKKTLNEHRMKVTHQLRQWV